MLQKYKMFAKVMTDRRSVTAGSEEVAIDGGGKEWGTTEEEVKRGRLKKKKGYEPAVRQ